MKIKWSIFEDNRIFCLEKSHELYKRHLRVDKWVYLVCRLNGQNSIIRQNSKDCIDQKCIIYNNNKIINNNNNKNDNQINGKNTDIIYNNNCSFSGSFSFHFGNSGASKISDPFYKTPENSNFFSYNSHNSQQNSIQSSNKSNIMSTNMDTENIFNHINNDNNSKDNI